MIKQENPNFLASVYAPNPMEVTYWIDLSEDANGNVIKTYDGKKWIPINNKEDNTQNSQIEHLLNIINEKANKKDVYTIAQTNDAINRSKTVVENVLTSTSTTTALSSAQGKILNDLITSLTARVQALEPEQPDWFKESIVAWYSPYCKQKLTNYDVIEAYVEDFTKWAYHNSRGIAKIANNTIVITNVVETNNIVEDDNKPCSDLAIRVTGVTENKYLIVRQGEGKPETHIKKDGVYTFKDNNLYFGFGVSVIGECNITITQLPTSILKDFSGNKHDAYLYGFKGKLNSGVGIYAQDFKNWNYGSTINNDISTKSYNKFHIVKKKADNYFGYTVGIPKTNYYNQPYKLKFSINKEIDDIKFSIVSTDGSLMTTFAYSVYINDGSIIDVPIISEEIFNNKEETNIYYDFVTNKDIEIDVELIANYPNQLCYDGKSYAVAYGLPILTDYTVIADRTWFAEKVDNGVFMSKALEQNGAFILEYKRGDKWNTYSYYSATNINIDKDNSIVYQTKNKYNEQTIYPGDKQDTDTLFIGTIRKDDLRSFIGCHSDILLFNRTLTEYEISWVKNNLMCSKPQEPDERVQALETPKP